MHALGNVCTCPEELLAAGHDSNRASSQPCKIPADRFGGRSLPRAFGANRAELLRPPGKGKREVRGPPPRPRARSGQRRISRAPRAAGALQRYGSQFGRGARALATRRPAQPAQRTGLGWNFRPRKVSKATLKRRKLSCGGRTTWRRTSRPSSGSWAISIFSRERTTKPSSTSR